MKKVLLMTLTLLSAMSLPTMASIKNEVSSDKKSNVALSIVGKSVESAMGLQQKLRSADKRQAFLQPNPYQSYFDQNPSAKTELKIDLDNFDMEYVLKVQ